jgi:RNA polymerase sigma factor (sigma-70 family)
MRDDAQLLRRYAEAGSESAFSELVSRHIDLVYSAALRQVAGDTHLAQDVAQTVFADLARKARIVSRHGVLTGWLYQATRFAAAKVVRTERRRATREKEALAMRELSADANWERLGPVLDEAMSRLGAKDRDAVLLRYFERKELRAVGDALGTSEEAARKRVSRALERLRRYLTARGVTLSAAALAAALTGSAVQAAPAGLAGTISSAVVAGVAAVAAGSTFNLLNFVSMTKLKAGLLSAAIVVGAGTPIVVQQQSVARLRAENRELREQSQQLEQLRAGNQQLDGLRADAEELERLRKDVAELHRLRAEVARLRSQNANRLRLAAESPAASKPGQRSPQSKLREYTPGDLWSDAGTSTPEASVETLLWVLRTSNEKRLREMIQWQVTGDAVGGPNVNLDAVERPAIDSMRRAVQQMEGGRIARTESLSENGVRIQFESTQADGQAVTNEIIFARQDTGWKVALSFFKVNDAAGEPRIRRIVPFLPEQVTTVP